MLTKLQRERYYPLVVAIPAVILWRLCEKPIPKDGDALNFYSSLISMASIAVGFIATAMSVVMSAPENSLLRQLKASNYMLDIIRYLKEPFFAGIMLCILCIIGFLLKGSPEYIQDTYNHAIIYVASWLFLGLHRMGRSFVMLMKAFAQTKR